MRDNFAATGQNSYVKPPAQDQSMWQALTNVMPITQGVLNPRWGYETFSQFFDVPITSISYNTSFNHPNQYAQIFVTSVAGLYVGQYATISENSNPLFNGVFTIAALSPGIITIFFSYSSSQSGTGGTFGAHLPPGITRLANFQSDATRVRVILATGLPGVIAYTEAGTVYNPNVFTPVAGSGVIRSITSRNYQYFCDGDNALDPTTHRTGDSLKWNGAAGGGVSNIGISTTDITVNTSSGGTTGIVVGPSTGSAVTDVPQVGFLANAWDNPPGIFTNALVSAAHTAIYLSLSGFPLYKTTEYLISDSLYATGFNFTAFPSPTVSGIQVALTYQVNPFGPTSSQTGSMIVQLLKNGAPVGGQSGVSVTIDGKPHTVTLGGPDFLWGTSFVPSDIINSGFGIAFYVQGEITINPGTQGPINAGFFLYDSYVTMTVYGASNAGTTISSGNGVGILSEGYGGIDLVIGRIYYLIGNNSLTGHFSDLSGASVSTGPCENADFTLLLATYNDPQVDFKYVLATADGGDPSILYQVPVLIPGTGFTITSWAIDGSGQVTFTGTFVGPAFPTGTTVTVVGLVHGAYLNGQEFVVTGSSPTDFTAAQAGAADSATEAGFAGIPTFAIPNSVTQVIDTTPDQDLVLDQPMLFTDTFGNEYGVTLNDPPPAGTLLIKHQGRLWMGGVPGATHSVFFSKSVTELTLPNGFIAGKYEESWPGSNYFDVSDGAESVAGFLSDGTTLYIGTQNHIRRLIGNNPTNFQEPQIVHPEVGLLNQEVWQIVFMQGAPSGSIWMTPDFRVIQSDFNTYVDIGTPIQDILNNLQPSAQSLAHAAFVADGEFELYILAVPYQQSTYCDTHLVFDLRARQWFVWKPLGTPLGGSLSLLFNVTQAGLSQWLFVQGCGCVIDQYVSTATTDNGITIPVTATTTWMNLGEPTRRKVLNEVQVYGNTEMTMNINGANNQGDFSAPRPIVYNRTLRVNPFDVWTLYLTGDRNKHRYYQFTFNATASQAPLLGSYSVNLTPLDDV